jgi:hypothetical protein
VGAQDSNYVYKDTALLYEDSVALVERELQMDSVSNGDAEADDAISGDDYITDTILISNQLTLNRDSVSALKNRQSFAYIKNLDSLLLERQQMEDKDTDSTDHLSWLAAFFASPVTKYFFWILAGVFIIFIIYKLFFAEGFFQSSYAKSRVTVYDDEAGDLSKTADYGKLILQAVNGGNYRLAVRYHYLQSLQKLAAKGLIQFTTDKTNYQYVKELSGKAYKSEFASLTLNYEYAWYGEFEIDEALFNTIQNRFKQFNSGV